MATTSIYLPADRSMGVLNSPKHIARPGAAGSGLPNVISRSTQVSNGVVGVFVLSLVFMSLGLLIAVCYLIMRFCNSAEEEIKRSALTSQTDKIPHPKRIYEIQAEEGCYSCPPSPCGRHSNRSSNLNSSFPNLVNGAIYGDPRSCPASVNARHVETGSLNRIPPCRCSSPSCPKCCRGLTDIFVSRNPNNERSPVSVPVS